jgi:hypothetical protein
MVIENLFGSDLYSRGLGWGAEATAGGGSESLRKNKQQTVGPFFTKIRKIAGPPVIWVPNNYKSLSTIIIVRKAKALNYRTFLIAAAQNFDGAVHTGFR